MKYYFIYKITNLKNNKIYIGKHITKDLNDGYMGSGLLIKKAIEKYGITNFKKEIIKYCSNEDELNKAESEIVTEDFCKRKDTYNINTGGSGGWYYINKEKKNLKGCKYGGQAMSLKLKDPLYYKNFCRIIKESCNDEVKLKISNSVKNHIKTFGHCWTGKKHLESTKEKMRNTFQSHHHQQGNKNSRYGTIWVYNQELKTSKSIQKIELDKYLDSGWNIGRIIKWN